MTNMTESGACSRKHLRESFPIELNVLYKSGASALPLCYQAIFDVDSVRELVGNQG